YKPLTNAKENKFKLVAINLPCFKNILSFFTQPGKTFVDELKDRLKVIACLEQPSILHSEQVDFDWHDNVFLTIQKLFKANDNDAQIILWCPEKDLKTAMETIEERCLLAFEGVPNETRKALADGTSIFERVLPGPDRMYPDTDSAPIPINENLIEKTKQNLPDEIFAEIKLLQKWNVPLDTYEYVLKNNLMPVIKKIVNECNQNPIFVVTTFAHTVKHINGSISTLSDGFTFDKVYGLIKYVRDNNLNNDIIKEMLPAIFKQPDIVFEAAWSSLDYKKLSRKKIILQINTLKEKFCKKKRTVSSDAKAKWIMGKLRNHVLGNMPLKELRVLVEKELHDG
ncbi:MAG: Glu-tRNA(Gln) amidotransferase GatDE subunit E, partial [Candidatus Zixiibacteriota bacterium]